MHHGPLGFFVDLLEPIFPVYDKIFGIFFNFFGPRTASILSVVLVAAIVALIISSFYLLLVDRDEYNRIRKKQKELQEKVKKAQEDDDMEKANMYMKESFSMQKEFMKTSFKPMIASMLVFFVIVPWVLTSFSPVVELEEVDNGEFVGQLEVKGFEGSIGEVSIIQEEEDYTIFFEGEEKQLGDFIQHEGNEWIVKEFDSENSIRLMFSYRFIPLPFSLPLIGNTFEWLGTFILFQLPFTIIFRKMLGIH